MYYRMSSSFAPESNGLHAPTCQRSRSSTAPRRAPGSNQAVLCLRPQPWQNHHYARDACPIRLATEEIAGRGIRATLSPCALNVSYFPAIERRNDETIAGPAAATPELARTGLAESLRGLWITSDPLSARNSYPFQAPSDLEGRCKLGL